MKPEAFRARQRAKRRQERAEFVRLEGFVNGLKWDSGPFGMWGAEPPRPVAVDRARQLSNKFWRKDRYEGEAAPTLSEPMETVAEANPVQAGLPGPVSAEAPDPQAKQKEG